MRLAFKLPVKILVPARTSVGTMHDINLNKYGNRFVVAKMKIMYEEEVRKQYFKKYKDVRMEKFYVLFVHHPKQPNIDTANVLSIVEKFACDGLQDVRDKKNKKIIKEPRLCSNDSRKNILGHFYFPGRVNKEDPHAEMILFDDKEEFLKEIGCCYNEKCTDENAHENQTSILTP